MMDTTKIFQNSWNLARSYRALWIFGVILALTTISFGSALWLNDEEQPENRTIVDWEISSRDQAWIKETFDLDLPQHYTLSTEDLQVNLDDPNLPSGERARLLRISLTILAVSLVLLITALVLRYTAEAALIAMVDKRQHRGQTLSARQGWSAGFSTTALKLFLIDVVGVILLLTATILLPLPALLPVFIVINGSPAAISVGLLLLISLMLVSVAAMIPLWIAGLVSLELAKRACSLQKGSGVFASLWQGIRLVRTQLRGVGLTTLVIAGIDLLYPVLVVPVGILLAAAGLVVGGGFALLLGALLALVLVKATAWTVAGIVGMVLLALIVAVPLAWLGGLRETFKSAAWTLTYREAFDAQIVERNPAPDPIQPQAAAA